nr:methylmalonyl-CoA mutase family protein [Dehalococcoidia bacterium]
MDSPKDLDTFRENSARWRDKQDPKAQRKPTFKTPSQMTVDQVYTPENTSQDSYLEKQGLPGEYPYLRGVHASGYRGRLWTMRMFAGFGLPEETNARFKFLMEQGQTGLSVAFDMPTLYGYD